MVQLVHDTTVAFVLKEVRVGFMLISSYKVIGETQFKYINLKRYRF